jgi:REP element-mobilizing transposase RayT
MMKIHEDIALYFTTSTIVEWVPVFTTHQYFNIITGSLAHCRREKGLKIYAYVIMLNHIHLIVSSDGQALSNIFRDFKRFTSTEITRLLKKDGNKRLLHVFEEAAFADDRNNDFKVWQDGFHPKAIYGEKFGNQKLEYIHRNPVKKGYVAKPEHWLHSSAAYYGGAKDIPLEINNLFKYKPG